ncbi:MAG: hypothetical protein J6V01_08950, partial [Clostridia bacterium]|nr:hypothetical protein [Clostridia bacterium]
MSRAFKSTAAAAALFIALAAAAALFGCSGGNADVPPATDTVAGSDTLPAGPEPVSLEGYSVVRPDRDDDTSISAGLRTSLEAAGLKAGIITDWAKSAADIPAAGKEILVGKTNRPESEELYSGLRTYDYRIKYFPESGRIAIAGGNDFALKEAVSDFLSRISDGRIPGDLSVERSLGEYRITKLMIDGTNVADYTVVTGARPDADLRAAAKIIVSAVEDSCGILLPVAASADGAGKTITLVKGTVFSADVKDGSVTLTAPGGSVVRAAAAFADAIVPDGASGETSVTLGGLAPVSEPAEYPAITGLGE